MADIYLNNAATSYPKPAAVRRAVTHALEAIPEDPGRTIGGKNSVDSCRQQIATLFEVADPRQIVFTSSATAALNMALRGFLEGGGHAVTSEVEHNSVLRPLSHMARQYRVTLTVLSPNEDGVVTPDALARVLHAKTRLVVLSHASNVLGTIQPVHELAEIAAEKGVPFLIDAAQSGGAVPLGYTALPGQSYLAFTGHKGLLGPSGTGGLVVPDDTLAQTVFGGTGIRSESALHPEELPLRHEAGTHNLPGIAGLCAGVTHLLESGVEAAGGRRNDLVLAIRSGLRKIPGAVLYPLANRDGRAGIVSFNLTGVPPMEIGFTLQEVFGIHVRAGLHCAPLIHKRLHTYPRGTVRVSVGSDNTMDDVARFLEAMHLISRGDL